MTNTPARASRAYIVLTAWLASGAFSESAVSGAHVRTGTPPDPPAHERDRGTAPEFGLSRVIGCTAGNTISVQVFSGEATSMLGRASAAVTQVATLEIVRLSY
jgi:hypothetical protein